MEVDTAAREAMTAKFKIGDVVQWRFTNGALSEIEGIVIDAHHDVVKIRWTDGREISYGPRDQTHVLEQWIARLH
jgi:Mechanosensitive ion channel